MKKKHMIIASLIMVAAMLAGCGSEAASVSEAPVSEVVESVVSETVASETETSVSESVEEVSAVSEEASVEADDTKESDDVVLVVVFSATGNTKRVAEKIAEFENADFYEIVPKELYTDEDLNYGNMKSRSSIEQNDPDSRPEIGSDPIDISGYTKIFVGYPIWWAIEPRIMDTFVESYDFTDKTVIPFCTSGSSGIGKSGTNLEALAGTGNWLAGKRFMSAVTDEKIKEWLDSID